MVNDFPADAAVVVLMLDADASTHEFDLPSDHNIFVVVLVALPVDDLAARCLPALEGAFRVHAALLSHVPGRRRCACCSMSASAARVDLRRGTVYDGRRGRQGFF